MLKKMDRFFDKLSNIIGNLNAIAIILLIISVFYSVITRYLFDMGSIAIQELQWHFFSVIILLGMSYTMQQDAHVRVDILYDTFGSKTKIWINIIGVILFVFPVMLVIGYGSIDYVIEAYQSNEQSSDPGGLTHRWIVKSLIPLSFFLLVISSVGFMVKQLIALKTNTDDLTIEEIKQ